LQVLPTTAILPVWAIVVIAVAICVALALVVLAIVLVGRKKQRAPPMDSGAQSSTRSSIYGSMDAQPEPLASSAHQPQPFAPSSTYDIAPPLLQQYDAVDVPL
jgi:hypothetical protein